MAHPCGADDLREIAAAQEYHRAVGLLFPRCSWMVLARCGPTTKAAGLLCGFPNAFIFEFVREKSMKGYPVYVLSATPTKRTDPLTLAAGGQSPSPTCVGRSGLGAEDDVGTPVLTYANPVAGHAWDSDPSLRWPRLTIPIWLILQFSVALTVSRVWFKVNAGDPFPLL